MIYLRCALVWMSATALAGFAGHWLLAAPSDPAFEGLLIRTCSLALTACLGWAWLATSAVVLDVVRRRSRARRGVPAGLRRVVLAACGVALLTGASPALATPGPVHLDGPVVVVPSTGHAGGHAARHASGDAVVVRNGDTLWSIAARHLPEHASDRQVTESWHRIYRRNRAVVGADPDLLRPGQRLELPR